MGKEVRTQKEKKGKKKTKKKILLLSHVPFCYHSLNSMFMFTTVLPFTYIIATANCPGDDVYKLKAFYQILYHKILCIVCMKQFRINIV